MTLLPTPLRIGNIDDAEAFVRHCVAKGKLVLTDEQRDELVAEGLTLLCELHKRYDPGKDKSAGQPGKTNGFFGYALFLLPKKLGDAWHRNEPTHVLRTREDGTRTYDYLEPPTSIESLRSQPSRGEDSWESSVIPQHMWQRPEAA